MLGPQQDDPARLTGDPLLHRRDGCYAYHLAVVVDDGAQGVTEVVRGTDLRGVTATHIRLQEALGLARPDYAHLGLVTAPGGARLGKRDGALGLARPEPVLAAELVPGFRWARVDLGPVAVPPGWCG